MRSHSTADSNTRSHAKLDAPKQGDRSDPDELAEAGWDAGGQGTAGTAHIEFETNDKGEREVKEAILDLALNFLGSFAHTLD